MQNAIQIDPQEQRLEQECLEWIKELSNLNTFSQVDSLLRPSSLEIIFSSCQSNIIVTSPVGSGKTIEAVHHAINCARKGKTVIIACPRTIICEQYHNLLRNAGVSCYRYYRKHKGYGQGINIVIFEQSHKVFMKLLMKDIKVDFLIVDEFHLLDNDNLFRFLQNNETRNVINLCTSKGIPTILLSATPTPKSLNRLRGLFEHVRLSTPATKTLKLYPSLNPLSSLIKMISDSMDQQRVVVFNDNCGINGELAVLFAQKGKRTLSLNNKSKDTVPDSLDWSGYDIVFATSVSGAGFSVQDGISTRVIVMAAHDGIFSVVQKAGRLRSNVSEYSVIMSARRSPWYRKAVDGFWAPGISNPNIDSIPQGWEAMPISEGKAVKHWVCKDIETYKQKIILFGVSSNNEIRYVYNDSFADFTGFSISSPSLQYFNFNKIELNVFSSIFRAFLESMYPRFTHIPNSVRDLYAAASLLHMAPIKGKAKPGIDILCNYINTKYRLDTGLMAEASREFREIYQCPSALAAYQDEVEQLAITFIQSKFFDQFSLDLPKTFDDLLSRSSRKRKADSRTADLLTQFIYSNIYPDKKLSLDPIPNAAVQLVSKLFNMFNEQMKSQQDLDPVELRKWGIYEKVIKRPVFEDTTIDTAYLREFVSKHITKGWDWIFGGEYIASNLPPDYENRLYIAVSQIVQLFAPKVKRHNVCYVISRENFNRFSAMLGEMISFKIHFNLLKSHLPHLFMRDASEIFLCPILYSILKEEMDLMFQIRDSANSVAVNY